MRRAAFGLYTYVEFVLLAIIFLIPMGLSALLNRNSDPTMRLRGRWMRRFGRTSAWFTPLWHFHVDGEPPADIAKRGYVVISNHESSADPFLLAHLPWDMRWIGKEEMNHWPIIGWLLKFSADIPLKRGSKESVVAMLAEARKTLLGGMPLMIFPEGTRSPDGNLLPFKDGAFQLAIETHSPVLLVAVAGTRQCRPKGSLWFGDANARARVIGAIPTDGMTMDDLPRLRELARDRIGEGARRLRADLGIPVASAIEAGTLQPHTN